MPVSIACTAQPAFGNLAIKKITPAMCQQLLDSIIAKGYGKTADEVRGLFRQFVRVSTRYGNIIIAAAVACFIVIAVLAAFTLAYVHKLMFRQWTNKRFWNLQARYCLQAQQETARKPKKFVTFILRVSDSPAARSAGVSSSSRSSSIEILKKLDISFIRFVGGILVVLSHIPTVPVPTFKICANSLCVKLFFSRSRCRCNRLPVQVVFNADFCKIIRRRYVLTGVFR